MQDGATLYAALSNEYSPPCKHWITLGEPFTSRDIYTGVQVHPVHLTKVPASTPRVDNFNSG